MERIIKVLVISALFMGGYAHAGAIYLSPGDEAYSGYDCAPDVCGPGVPEILAWLNANVDDFDQTWEAYKSDEDGDAYGSDSGAFAGNYTTTFSNSVGDPSDATISQNGGDYIDGADWLLVKDGKHSPMWYLFDISDWDGMMDIVLTGFWPEMGAISHVAIRVPEPGTLTLLGMGLLAIGLLRRKIAA